MVLFQVAYHGCLTGSSVMLKTVPLNFVVNTVPYYYCFTTKSNGTDISWCHWHITMKFKGTGVS